MAPYGAPPVIGGPKPPRPKAVVAGALVLAGVAFIIAGAFLPWITGHGESFNGMDNYRCIGDNCYPTHDDLPNYDNGYGVDTGAKLESPGIFGILGAVVLAGFGITLLAAGRVVVIGILTIIFGVIGVLVAIGLMVTVGRIEGGSYGVGMYMHLLGPILATIGGIAALAMRSPRTA